ncbi:trypsin-like serine peptidase [Providencia rettgeri]|uniref:trypsin-like serine peptidase n=1 Tax=Providencia rettgeri TaxID=587 RepID=UPI00235DDB98|nr:serine protease [Providencia rettgeri]ELR5151701.1 trypsin-like peptidase domain-containing protein [Providencia rettgeri]ELR5153187.1 trypsin-like peptidase domain-containing protein [Providencia rettgeri]
MDVYKLAHFNEKININVIKNNIKGKIHSFFVERTHSTFLKLHFSNIHLPQNSYVEFEYGDSVIQRENFYQINDTVVTIPSSGVNIRVRLPLLTDVEHDFSFFLDSIEHDNNSRVIIGQDERKPYMCHEGSPIAEYALSSAAARIGGWGSCSLIGSENHVLTNNHVVESDLNLINGEIWFNWFNETCSSTSTVTEPVRLKPGRILKRGISSSDNDYALFTLNEFDYVNSNVKALFGGLALSHNNPVKGENIYVPQYGDGGLRPMYIGDIKNGKFAEILNVENDGNKIVHNADTQGGSSGSPVISRVSNQIIGLHWGGGSVNVGVSAQKLNIELGNFIDKSNTPITGLGKIASTNLELTPISSFDTLIPISLSEGSRIQPFDTVKIENHDNYSTVSVEALDLITNETFPLIFKACLVKEDYQGHLQGDITGDVFLKLYDFVIEKNGISKSWFTFKISDDAHNIKNHVIRLIFDHYDPYEVPFDIESAEVLVLNLSQDKKNTTSYTVNGNDYYGFVALYRGQGPLSLVWSEKAYSLVKGLLKNSLGDEVLVNFRASRQTECASNSMNTAAACSSQNKFSRLELEYLPKDNPHLVLENCVYEGIIPLQAKSWQGEPSKNILVKVSLRSE